MLQEIRARAQGWIAWFIVILISVPFALWGIQSYLGGGSAPVVASVNGQEITERAFETAYRDFRQRLRQQLGASYRPELIDEAMLRKEVLDSMIREEVILQAAQKMGLGAGDDLVRSAIMSIPSFQVDGRFNQQAYERGVQLRGLTPTAFEAQVRRALITEQLSKAVTGSEIATDAEMLELVRLRQQKRDFSYFVIPLQRYLDDVQVTADEIKKYYDGHQDRFMAPERVKVEYLELDVANIAKTLKVDEETLQGYYEQHRTEYVSPEQRRASHILIPVDEGADEQVVKQARQQAEAALKRIRDGESFADVAKEVSQDPGSAAQGGDLGFFEKGVMDDAFDKAVFSMQEGGVSEPVRSSFGFHIIKLTGIRPEQGKAFADIRKELETSYLKSEAERLFYEYAERLSDLAYEDPDSLQPAADALGMETKQSDWFDRNGGSGIFASTKLVGAAFSDDVLVEGHNSEAIEVGPEQMVVLRVTEHEEAAIRPLDKVRDEIVSLLKREKAEQQAQAQADKLLTEARDGRGLQQIAKAEGQQLTQKSGVGRDDKELPPDLLNSLFKVPRPASADAHAFGKARLGNGDVAIIELERVVDGTMDEIEQLGGEKMLKNALEQSRGRSYYRHLVESLKARADIKILKKEG